MPNIDHFLIRTVFFVFVLLPTGLAPHAQTTIFNIPTADTLPRGSWNLEADLAAKPVSYRNGGYQTYGYRLAYGLRSRLEIGSNVYYTWNGFESTGQVEFSIKRKVYQNKPLGIRASTGAVLCVPFKSRNGDRTSGIVYGNVSKAAATLRGLTVTGGVYHIFGGRRDFGTRTGAIIGVVQPINRRVSFVADWFSGSNRLGYASAGLNFNLTKKQYLLTGYSFGNSGRGNNALAAYWGITF